MCAVSPVRAGREAAGQGEVAACFEARPRSGALGAAGRGPLGREEASAAARRPGL